MGSPVKNQPRTCQFLIGNPPRPHGILLTGRRRKWCAQHAELVRRANTRVHVAKHRAGRDDSRRRLAYRWAQRTERYFAEARVPVTMSRRALIRFYRQALELEEFDDDWTLVRQQLDQAWVTALIKTRVIKENETGRAIPLHPLDFRWVCFSPRPVAIEGAAERGMIDRAVESTLAPDFFTRLGVFSLMAGYYGWQNEEAAMGIILPVKGGYAMQWHRRPIVNGVARIPRALAPGPLTRLEEWPIRVPVIVRWTTAEGTTETVQDTWEF